MGCKGLFKRRGTAPLAAMAGDHGAVAVEAAFILPIMVLLFAGIVEYATMFRHGLAVSNAARQGARTAAVVGTAPDADFRIVQSTLGSRGFLSTADIDAVVVYKATATNGDIPADCLAALSTSSMGVTGSCNIYRRSAGFLATSSPLPWAPSSRSNDIYGARDFIGVYLATNFRSPLQVVVRNRTVADRTVFHLDPGGEQPMTIGGTMPTVPPGTGSTTTTTSGSSSTTTTTGPGSTTTTGPSSTTTTGPTTTRPPTTTTRPPTTTTRPTTTTTRPTTTTTRPPTTTTGSTTTGVPTTTTTRPPTTTTTRPPTTTTTRPATTTTFSGGAL